MWTTVPHGKILQEKLGGEGTSESREWGGWLRAPSRWNVGGNRNKWLRDGKGGEWESEQGRDDYDQRELRKVTPQTMQPKSSGPQDREKVVNQTESSKKNTGIENFSNFKEGTSIQNSGIGPQEGDELSGLIFEERKRQRSGDNGLFDKNNNDKMVETGSGFSDLDYSESSPQFLATLPQQASHSK